MGGGFLKTVEKGRYREGSHLPSGITGCGPDPCGGLSNAAHGRHELRTPRGRGQDWRRTHQRPHTEGTSAVRAGSRVHLTQNKLWREEWTGHKELAEEA